MLKFLGKYNETGLLLLRASIGILFILVCGPVLFAGQHRWAQFGSVMRMLNFHAHLEWWGFFGAIAGSIGGVLMVLGLAFRLGVILALLVAIVNVIYVGHYAAGLYPKLVPIELVTILVCLALVGPGKYSVDGS